MAITKRAAALGERGEELAARYVEELGWQVVDRNWRCRAGEIDLVALDQASATLVVVEVKSRSSIGYGHPLEAVTPAKLNRLLRLAAAWAAEHQARVQHLRVDAVGVVMPPGGEVRITHLRGLVSR